MKKIITILMMLFLFAGMSTMDAKPLFGHKSRNTYYRSQKFKKRMARRSKQNFKHACEYNKWYKRYTKSKLGK